MTCYKLVTAKFKWFGLQNKIEQLIHEVCDFAKSMTLTATKIDTPQTERKIFLLFHRQVFCWLDRWYGLTIQDIREIEERTINELDEVGI